MALHRNQFLGVPTQYFLSTSEDCDFFTCESSLFVSCSGSLPARFHREFIFELEDELAGYTQRLRNGLCLAVALSITRWANSPQADPFISQTLSRSRSVDASFLSFLSFPLFFFSLFLTPLLQPFSLLSADTDTVDDFFCGRRSSKKITGKSKCTVLYEACGEEKEVCHLPGTSLASLKKNSTTRTRWPVSVSLQRPEHNLAGDANDPKAHLHVRAVCFDRHAAGKTTIIVRLLHIAHVRKLLWRPRCHVSHTRRQRARSRVHTIGQPKFYLMRILLQVKMWSQRAARETTSGSESTFTWNKIESLSEAVDRRSE